MPGWVQGYGDQLIVGAVVVGVVLLVLGLTSALGILAQVFAAAAGVTLLLAATMLAVTRGTDH